MTIQNRKKDHVDVCLNDDVNYQQNNGLQEYQFVHNALPEVDFDEVTTEAELLGRTFSFPLFVSSMTGGYSEAGSINSQIAEFCEKNNLPFGVGSQRAMLEHPEERESFAIVREKAPTAFIAANIGGAQLIGGLTDEDLNLMVNTIKADAVIVHLNPLQELIQPEGDRNFSGIEQGIRKLVVDSEVPVIVKETGAGINSEVARRLLAAGVQVIDVAGAGGTSWAKVENKRRKNIGVFESFDNWGIQTADCVEQINNLREVYRFELIASGGVYSAHDMVKSICLGADFTANARPVIQALFNGGLENLQQLFDTWTHQTRMILTLLGCKNLKQCNQNHLIK